MTILELREKRAKAWDAAKAFLDSHRTDKGTLSAEDDAAYSRMEQDISDLGKEPTPAWSRISPTWARRSPGWSAAKLWTPS